MLGGVSECVVATLETIDGGGSEGAGRGGRKLQARHPASVTPCCRVGADDPAARTGSQTFSRRWHAWETALLGTSAAKMVFTAAVRQRNGLCCARLRLRNGPGGGARTESGPVIGARSRKMHTACNSCTYINAKHKVLELKFNPCPSRGTLRTRPTGSGQLHPLPV